MWQWEDADNLFEAPVDARAVSVTRDRSLTRLRQAGAVEGCNRWK